MRVIVCGSHKRGDRGVVFAKLDHLHARRGIDCVIEGGAKFIDTFAKEWAVSRGVPHEEYPAEWTKLGRAAGPIRNKRMIDEGKPDGVVAFPGDDGTANMMDQAWNAGLKVWEPLKILPSRKPA